LDEGVIKHGVLLAAGHKGEASHIGEHRPSAILAVEPKERTSRGKVVCGEIACDRGKSLTQFRAVMPVASVAETAEPLIAMGLSNRRACTNNLPAFASSVARSAHVIQPAKGRRKLIGLR
jgi:hypothetical protein